MSRNLSLALAAHYHVMQPQHKEQVTFSMQSPHHNKALSLLSFKEKRGQKFPIPFLPHLEVTDFLSKCFSDMQVWNCMVENSLHEPKSRGKRETAKLLIML